MSLMTAVEIGASGLTAQRKRLEVHVSNLVNANTVQPADKEPFRRKEVLFNATNPEMSFGGALDDAVQGVEIAQVVTDRSELKPAYEPNHKYADKDGYVYYPNVNAMAEMVDVMSATRSYEANLQAVNQAKDMLQKTLEILK
jgi:flagellar basal-body rod protein FlgC